MTSHSEIIKCPECGHEQTATVKHALPWFIRIHDCDKCEYTIMESEWETIEKAKP